MKFIGVDALHAAFLNESRTRDRLLGRVQEIRARTALVIAARKSGALIVLTREGYMICVAGSEGKDRGGEIALRRSSSPRTMFSP